MRYVKDVAGEHEFEENGGKHEDVVGDDAGSQHVAGCDGSYMEAAKNALFPEHDESSAKPPEAAHDGEGDDRSQEKFDDHWLTFGEHAGIEKEKSERHKHGEEQKHFIAHGELNAHAGE
jgi:hypothetical protein